jgi:molybdate transport system ATP-binding protein
VTLAIDVEKRLGDLALAANIVCGVGLTAIFGRSGAGKSSLLNMAAGLVRPDRGRITLDDDVLFDSARGVDAPTWRRRVGYVFQDARLLPHLSVRQNLLFGRWFARRADRRFDADEIVALLGLGPLLARAPQSLSGGEKQRVAIGRALLASPRLLLMDEPLASLDEERKQEVLPYIERLRDSFAIPILYVSHSLPEVLRLANAVALIRDGRVAAFGPAEDVLRADDLGDERNAGAGALIEARVVEHDRANALTVLAARGARLYVPAIGMPVGARARLRIRARDVMIALERPERVSALNIMPGRIVSLDPAPDGMQVEIDCAGDRIGARLTRKSVAALALEPGLTVYAVLKSVALDSSSVAGAPGGSPR